jgi:hypothetical protein
MKLSLYSIEQEYIQLAEELTNHGGELTPELETALAINQKDLQTKATNYGLVIKQFEYNVNTIDLEIERLKYLKQVNEKSIDRLKESVKNAMEIYGIEKIETPILKLSFRKSESVEIENEALIPSFYFTEKTTRTISKTEIKKAIQEGSDVPGASLKTNQNLQIK